MSESTTNPVRVPVYRTISKSKEGLEDKDQGCGGLIAQVTKEKRDFVPIRTSEERALFKVMKCLCTCFRRIQPRVYVEPEEAVEPIIPLQSPQSKGKKTLVLDLDETLVHSTFKKIDDPDTVLQVFVEGRMITIYVRYRPGLKELLQAVAKNFEVIVFTASLAKYADPLIDIIDPEGYVEVRLFRDSCKRVNEIYVKDLRSLGRDMSQVILVDVIFKQNSPDSYSMQPENAIPIRSFFDDPDDVELFKLVPLLDELASVVDVRETIKRGMDLTASCLLPMPRDGPSQDDSSADLRVREDASVPEITDGTQADLRWELNSPRNPH